MKTRNSILLAIAMLLLPVIFTACASTSGPKVVIPPPIVGASISDTTHSGTVKGTMLEGHTYYMDNDFIINKGDTLLIQDGVTVIVRGASLTNFPEFQVYGTMICNGTKAAPIYITVDPSKRTYKNLQNGLWGGIQCAATSGDLIIKWTHLEYGGGAGSSVGKGANAYVIFFQNQNSPVANFIMEDSWVTGATDDPIRVSGGHISYMRNVMEAGSTTSGDGLNIKSGVQGDAAFNLFIGDCTNGPKLANKGGLSQTNVNFYNNTMVTCGWRFVGGGRAGSTNIEDGARGIEYNNLIINCYSGFRLVNNPLADSADVAYDYQWCYANNDTSMANMYPGANNSGCEVPRPNDRCDTKNLGAHNPMFAGYNVDAIPASIFNTYPIAWAAMDPRENVMKTSDSRGTRFSDLAALFPSTSSFTSNFNLQSGSPCVGTAYSGPTVTTPSGKVTISVPMAIVPLKSASNPYGASLANGNGGIQGLGKDFGAYQTDGTGNQQQ